MLKLKVKTGVSVFSPENYEIRYDLINGRLEGPRVEGIVIFKISGNHFGIEAPPDWFILNDGIPDTPEFRQRHTM